MTEDRVMMHLERIGTRRDAPNPRRWLARAGHAAFWFFAIKGLAWLAAPVVFYLWL
ncbi:MAG: hypothetical protein AAFX44_01755 [Pseudomonadota bacterium]